MSSQNEVLASNEFTSIMTSDLKYLFEVFRSNSYELRIAGGAVRDLLMGKVPHDIDFATTATPDQMKEMFSKENLRMINTNGEKHGTITVRLNDKENYEITTLRIDVLTDGRHAEVKFTEDWRLDANRRDLTVNSIFLTCDGQIIDFFEGYNDIKLRRVRFVGEPCIRIQEDYLRILRYFRFYGRICLDENSHENESLRAIKENSAGLQKIAGERLWVELKQIVVGRYADSLMKHMIETQVAKHLGFDDDLNLNEFSRLYKLYETRPHDKPMSITMICSLLNSPSQFEKLHKRMKFSNDEKKLAEFLFTNRNLMQQQKNNDSLDQTDLNLKPFKNILVENIKDIKIMEKLKELLKYINKLDYFCLLETWPIPVFPITGEHLTSKNVPKGPIYSKILNSLKNIWRDDFNFNCEHETINKLLVKCDELLTNKEKK